MLGSYRYTVDAKGRVGVPRPFREYLKEHSGDTVVLSKSLAKVHERCLIAYPQPVWEGVLKGARTLSNRDFTQYLTANSVRCQLDSQGRILIPVGMREHAKLNGDVVVNGGGDRFEIWNPEQWQSKELATLADQDRIREDAARQGFQM